MASENNEIGDIVKRCKILLLDIEGTTTSISFVKDKLFPYAEDNVKEFLESQWDTEDVKEAVAALRKLAVDDGEQKVEGVVAIPGEDAGKDEQIEGLVKSVKWLMSADRKAGPLKQLQGLIWNQGYIKGDIKGHVYDDVAPALTLWNSTEAQKVYIYSSGSVQAQKLLFGSTAAGDLLPHIEGHFDTTVGAKQEAASYAAIVEKIGCKPEDILFLTDIVQEAEAARSSGLQAALVSREGNAPLPAAAAASYPVLQSFEQLTVTNKRKPEPQEQEVPAKVPKTDLEANVKTATEMEVSKIASEAVSETVAPSETVSASEEITAEKANGDESEKMDVEEETPITEAAAVTEQAKEVAKEAEETAVRIETTIEEVSTSNEAGDAPVSDVKPIIQESVEKTDENETEKMETESAENIEAGEIVDEPKEEAQEKVNEKNVSVAEESSAVQIQDVTNDQEFATEGVEMADDLVPVVEEPPTVEMEDLNSVADVLDKECDEILLKVHDVTNLDNIPAPMLNSIAEEDIEVDNGENTNDIVDSILDSEMELGVKPCEDIDVNVVHDIAETKADSTEVIPDKGTENDAVTNKAPEIPAETSVAENIVTETNITDKTNDVSCPETVTEVVKDKESPAASEVTNGDMQECPVDVLPEPDSKTETDTKESKEVAEKVADKILDSKTATEDPEDTVMESEESSVAVVASQPETKESEIELLANAKPAEDQNESVQNTAVSVENEVDMKNTIEEKDDKMESENTAEVEKNEAEMKESNAIQVENEKKSEESNVEAEENKMESEECVPQESQAKESIVEPEAAAPESKLNENETPTPTVPEPEVESKESASQDIVMDTEATEKVNGKTNGEPEVNQNGDASKEEELSARLSVENGENDKEMNGANGNGDSSEVEKGQGDNKEKEIPDIKVKTVSTDEPRTDPIEQPVEA